MDRRTLLGTLGAAAPLAFASPLRGLTAPAAQQPTRYPLRRVQSVRGDRLTLTARVAPANVGPGAVEAFTLNGLVPAPTVRLREGQRARIELVNELAQPTILHWHGLAVPQEADGHPRLAIPPGGRYAYDFTVRNRAGTYWYHPHTHMLTAYQTYRGMGGFLIIEGDEEESLRLPRDEYEIPMVLQDKRLAGSLSLEYPLGMGPDMMMGFLGDTPFGNGVARPRLEVRRAAYRFRLLNGSNSRIFELALSNGQPLTLIGTDGGLLAAPASLSRITMAPAERADVMVDFSTRRPGERIVLRSLAFEIPGMMMGMGMGRAMGRGMGRGMMGRMGGLAQGAEMDLVELVVQDTPVLESAPLPGRLAELPALDVRADTPRRTFRFTSMMMNHTINGRSFALERIDERVPLGRTEVWTFVNESALPHPVHAHGGQFRVVARTGGRARVMPWETGFKDTVLVLPGERVAVAVHFSYPGVFLLHCHNLEHEDSGMMLNFEVIA